MEQADEYQRRYLQHQQVGKKQELIALMKERHSNRMYADDPVPQELIDDLIESAKHCPSSCDRHGVRIKVVTERDDKSLLGGILVGGVGWIHRAPIVFLLLADPRAYKGGVPAGDEINYNSYLDAGVMVQQLSLTATALGLHCAFVNPQIREQNLDIFEDRFTPVGWDSVKFMGAFCFGFPHPESIPKTRDLNFNLLVT